MSADLFSINDCGLNQIDLLAAVTRTVSPSALMLVANKGICFEKPAFGSLVLVMVFTPSKASSNSSNKKKAAVVTREKTNFLFQLRLDVSDGWRVDIRWKKTGDWVRWDTGQHDR